MNRALLLFMFVISAAQCGQTFLATAHGIKADGQTNNTQALQGLIDRCATAGGGTVVIDTGTVVSGTLSLKSGVTLKIAEGATLMNTGNRDDYPYCPVDFLCYYPQRRTMIYAQNQKNIAVVGNGVIDGACRKYKSKSSESARVSLIRFDGCTNVSVKDVTLQNASMWTQHFFRCEDVAVSGVTVKNHMKNDDGLNVDGCRKVTIENCDITAHDDAITLKNTSHRPCKDVTVTNCRLKSMKSAFKFGTETYDGFINITVRDVKITGGRDALALFSVDGARIENVLIENVEVTDTRCPLIVFLGRRLRKIEGDKQVLKVGSVNGITIRNLNATGAQKAIILAGMKGYRVKGITLENIDVAFAEAAPSKAGRRRRKKKAQPSDLSKAVVNVDEKGYPSSSLFGTLNAWALFVRHAEGIILKDIVFRLAGKSTAHKAYLEDTANVVLPEDLKSEAVLR